MATSSRARASQVKTAKVDPSTLPPVDSPIPSTITSAENVQNQQEDKATQIADLMRKLEEVTLKANKAEELARFYAEGKHKAAKGEKPPIIFRHPVLGKNKDNKDNVIMFKTKDSTNTRSRAYFWSMFENLRYPIRLLIEKIEENRNDPTVLAEANMIHKMLEDSVDLIKNKKSQDMLTWKWVENPSEPELYEYQARLVRNAYQFANNYSILYLHFLVAFDGLIKGNEDIIRAIVDIRKKSKELSESKQTLPI